MLRMKDLYVPSQNCLSLQPYSPCNRARRLTYDRSRRIQSGQHQGIDLSASNLRSRTPMPSFLDLRMRRGILCLGRLSIYHSVDLWARIVGPQLFGNVFLDVLKWSLVSRRGGTNRDSVNSMWIRKWNKDALSEGTSPHHKSSFSGRDSLTAADASSVLVAVPELEGLAKGLESMTGQAWFITTRHKQKLRRNSMHNILSP